jgi:hypothetical protein
MNIPPFWAKEKFTDTDPEGQKATFAATGWSFQSLDDARQNARSRAKRIFDLVTTFRSPNEYEYFDRPIREEIVETIHVGDGEPALITRNRYGALVLNTAAVCFVDVDCPSPHPSGLVELIKWLFSSAMRERMRAGVWQRAMSRVEQWSAQYPGQSFRLYRTHSGLRLLFVDKTYGPSSEEVAKILSELGSDPLYRKLTNKHHCFRARLTPKPWRCGMPRPPCDFPWHSGEAENAYRAWEQQYAAACSGYMTCALLSPDEPTSRDPRIQQVIEIHDKWVCRDGELPLA